MPVVLATTDRPRTTPDEAPGPACAPSAGPTTCWTVAPVPAGRRASCGDGDNLSSTSTAARVLNVIAPRADHVVEEGLPHGCASKPSRRKPLRADRMATNPADREHVTTLIRRDRACFNALVLSAPGDVRRPQLRLDRRYEGGSGISPDVAPSAIVRDLLLPRHHRRGRSRDGTRSIACRGRLVSASPARREPLSAALPGSTSARREPRTDREVMSRSPTSAVSRPNRRL